MSSILLIEADPCVLALLVDALRNQGYAIDTATHVRDGLERAIAYDLVLLNPRLAEFGTVHPCQQLRSQGYQKPILLLLDEASTDGICGLDAGADDYVVKPYKLPDLFAHVRALLRRQQSFPVASSPLLHWGELVMDPHSVEVTYRANPLTLTPKEFRLLELFLRHPKRVFSRTAILDHIWGFATIPHESTVTNHIKELRQKLKTAGLTADIIETIYGLGYRLKPPPASELSPVAHQRSLASQDQSPSIDINSIRPQVLILGEDTTLCSALGYLLQPWGFHVTPLDNPALLWDTLATVKPDLLILDLELSHWSGIDLCRKVRQHEEWGDLLILVVTSDTNAEAIQLAFVAGADDFVSKPIVGPELVTRVTSRLERRRPHPNPSKATISPPQEQARLELSSLQSTYGNILLVDDQPENLQTLSKILSTQGYKVRKALKGPTALDAVHSQKPDLIVLDVRMPEMNGYEVCAALKADVTTRDIPVLFLSALDDTADKLKAFAVGGADYITKPFQAEEVLARIKHQMTILQQKRQLTIRNRQLQREIQERQQSQMTLEQMQLAFQESEARLQSIFDHATIALALISTDDRWLRISPVLCSLLGRTEAELLSLPISACLELLGTDQQLSDLLVQAQDSSDIELLCRSKLNLKAPLSFRVWSMGATQTMPLVLMAQFRASTNQE